MKGPYGNDYDIYPMKSQESINRGPQINSVGYNGHDNAFPRTQESFSNNQDGRYTSGLGYGGNGYMSDQGYPSDGYLSDQPYNTGETPEDNDILFDASKFNNKLPMLHQKSNKEYLREFDFHIPGKLRFSW